MSGANGLGTGGPAFPTCTGIPGMQNLGMSLRHFTATAALPLAVEMLKIAIQTGARVELSPQVIARNALLIADALINEQRLFDAPK